METEYLIQQALNAVMRGRTTFVVASRRAQSKMPTRSWYSIKGLIAERGTHAALLAQGGLYTRLYDLQLRDQEEFEERTQASLTEQKREVRR